MTTAAITFTVDNYFAENTATDGSRHNDVNLALKYLKGALRKNLTLNKSCDIVYLNLKEKHFTRIYL
jgi:hypothetical protein